MKRSRVDEVQFGARGGPHRILTPNSGPTIQYLGPTGTLKSNNASDASSIGAPAPTVQYTTCKIKKSTINVYMNH